MAEGSAPDGQAEGQTSPVPAITLPKGGGAIRGMGEKFAANPVSGTGSMSVPIATSPGRSGFGPRLELSYDSGAGNGPFGFGWSLSVPAITRKTDKGLPQYRDGDESDVFILSGAEDLVPVLRADGSRVEDTTTAPGYRIHPYRPRIEGLFAQIERWTSGTDPGDVHWRSLSRDNMLTLYGKDASSRITDPDDPRRIFSWRICETRDTKGNAVIYGYKPEDGVRVDLSSAHERNRGSRDDPRRSVNGYLDSVRYGNRVPLLTNSGNRPRFLTKAEIDNADWCFEAVFDYGQHDRDTPMPRDEEEPAPPGHWPARRDPFSTHRAGFEVRTYRLCHRVLMFHHFPDEPGVGQDCLVRSTDLTYRETPVASFVTAVTHTGYRRTGDGYLGRSLPALEFTYSEAAIDETVHDVDSDTLENLPAGVDGASYRWVDLDGEGLSGVLSEQAGAWFYKPNCGDGRLGPLRQVARRPSLAALGTSRQQFLDLAGDGPLDLVEFGGPTPGFYERTGDEGEFDTGDWDQFRPFRSLPNISWDDPDLRMVDLDGDGRADVLVTEHEALTWYPSLGEDGFGAALRVHQPRDEERGPQRVLSDGTQQIYLADMCGDGLNDLVRIRNGDVCYWPNLGYGRFGTKVTMDNAPLFDRPDQFSQQRLRVADIDGSGNIDLIYIGRDGVRLYFNQSGNSWSDARRLSQFPHVDNLAAVTVTDLLGNGTACLVWSSPLPHDAGRQMRYIDLMGGQKPHLLVRATNNLGAETHVHYASSTKFSVRDRAEGRPWITRLPFPVHVIERVETYDRISRNRFVTRYAYHHGYFDGVERELRGFAMVEQWDTESFAALSQSGDLPAGENINAASHVPPAYTKTWFHTGVYLGRGRVSNFFAGLLDDRDGGEYYREPAWRNDDGEARKRLLDDTVLPPGLTLEEEREACRALKGSMLRQEIYARDGTDKANNPYTVTEQNFTVRMLQPRRGRNRHAVFLAHAREAINYHYERNPADPRVSHTLTLEVDSFGNVLKEAAVAYGRRQADASLPLPADRAKQTSALITYTESLVTNGLAGEDHHTPLPARARTYELTGYAPAGSRFRHSDFVQPDPNEPARLVHVFDEEIDYAAQATTGRQRRLIEHVRTLYRRNDLTGLLGLGTLESLALPGESYQLAFTAGLLAQVFQRPRQGQLTENLIPNPASLVGGEGGYVDLDGDGRWWVPAGRVFHSPNSTDTATQELAHARAHFFLTQRYRDPFGHTSTVTFDDHDLLMRETRDSLGNRVTVGERKPNGDIDTTKPGNDYRVLQPWRVMDANRNRTQVAFDALGMVVGTAVMGKPEENLGDTLAGFEADLSDAVIVDHLDTPLGDPRAILQRASMRLVYDVLAYQRTKNQPNPRPTVAYTLARETHDTAPGGQQSKVQHAMAYSDGFGREVQTKIQAEPGPVPRRDANGLIVVGADGQPEMTANDVNPRWVGSGWTIFNNKGKPVRQYEPFFSDTHRFEFGVRVGVSPILFYDPIQRVVATLHPNHTYEKVVFDPWRQVTYDVNDTVAANGTETGDPRTDPDIRGYVARYFATLPAAWQTWRAQRLGTAFGVQEQAAATKAVVHANTPVTAHFDTLGRPFLTVARNRFVRDGATVDEAHPTRVEVDIEGNQRAVRDAVTQNGDALGRVVMRYDYDLLGNRIHQASMEAGRRWTLNDVAGKAIRAWDSRGHTARTEYDPARRPVRVFVTGADPDHPTQELLTERLVYGEQHPDGVLRNLRGRVCLHLDQAGVVSNAGHDFKGNLLASSRRISREYRKAVEWRTVNAVLPPNATAAFDPVALEVALAPLLEADIFASSTTYDALNRAVTLTTPDASVIRPGYNEANRLERMEANLRGVLDGGQRVWTPFVTDIAYDAKGQRTQIIYGSGATTDRQGVTTTYSYDRLTTRLARLTTRRDARAFPDDCPQPPAAGWPGCQLQDLRYTYDPAGNITHIVDGAQQAVFFRNVRVEPSSEYTYDALYRLIEATGREHLGQVGGTPIPHSHDDSARVGLLHRGDGAAMGIYAERYAYDAVGNILQMQHRGTDPAHAGWTRNYSYGEASLTEAGKMSNRLSATTVNGGNPLVERYRHDAHGNMTRMPHLGGADPDPNMHWDYKDQLCQVDMGGGGTAYYIYGSTGQRVRKVWEKAPGLTEERIYLGGLETFRRRNGSGVLRFERETLHITDDQKRIALVETRTVDVAGNDLGPPQLIRYQLGNHLGSTSFELDDRGQIISYEENAPYGSTSYQAVRSQTETPKRYRYISKERDDESALCHHGRRYYAPWLGKWTSVDPIGISGGIDLYGYAANNPLTHQDPDGTQPQTAPPLRLPTSVADARSVLRELQTRTSSAPNVPVMFKDRGVSVVVMRLPEPYVVSRGTGQTFTAAARASDTSASETVINTNLYEKTTAIPGGVFGPADRSDYRAQGQVLSGGRVVGGRSSPDTYHFAWTQTRPQQVADQQQKASKAPGFVGPPAPPAAPDVSDAWQFGQGDPPAGAGVAFGGGIPVIIGGLRFGSENKYAPGAPSGLPVKGDPGAGNGVFLVQRSNAGFADQEARGNRLGKVVVGIERESNTLIIVAQEDGENGMKLSEIRDSLSNLGVDDALAWDGSDSATLVTDSTVQVSPGKMKNNTIPAGAGFRLR